VYLGFCIAALVACCEESGPGTASVVSRGVAVSVSAVEGAGSASNPTAPAATGSTPALSKRASYIAQLQAVVLGKGAKSQRRLTIRSRLRAAFALQLIVTNADSTIKRISASAQSSSSVTSSAQTSKNTEETSSVGDSSLELNRMVPFLECLAELQETRLPCSEEVLMDALCSPPSLSSTFPSSSSSSLVAAVTDKEKEKEKKAARTDVRVLVRTWLHDEGSHQEVGNGFNIFT
jgi:hypothetical protein